MNRQLIALEETDRTILIWIMICTTIQNKSFEQVLEALESCEMAEIRLDRCPLSEDEIRECFTSDVPLVATCRVSEIMESEPSLRDPELTVQSRTIRASQIAEKRLCRAIESGARFVDVEVEAPKSMAKRVLAAARENGTVFIRSYHNFTGTDSYDELKSIVEKCRYHGAEIVKIVTMAGSVEDTDRVMRLYEEYAPSSLIAFCMGEAGRGSRIECLRKGSPYTYAAMSESEAAAPGQWDMKEMRDAVYGNFRFVGASASALRMPASKSFAQRAIIAAALAEGESHLDAYTPCSDSEAAIAVARALGAEVSKEKTDDGYDRLVIKGIACAPASVDIKELNVGESGLLTRLMIPLAAQIAANDVTITGERTLLQRPMKGAGDMLAGFGVQLESGSEDCRVPLKVCGTLVGGRSEISGRHGSQLISGLLMALPFNEKNSSVVVNDPKSIPYMFITLDVLKRFGIKVANEMSGGRDFFESDGDWSLCTEMTFKVRGNQHYHPACFELEGDWSAAANFLVAGAVFGRAELAGLDTTSLQADLSIMDILMDAGASLSQLDGDKGIVAVQRAPLNAFNVDASNCPDLFPIVSVLAAFCQGTSRIVGVDRLAHKESDRGAAIVGMLTKMGVHATVEGNELVIEGESLASRCLNGRMLKSGKYTSSHDHRMVMALKVAEIGADGRIEIDDEACVDKSFPGFLEMFGSYSGAE